MKPERPSVRSVLAAAAALAAGAGRAAAQQGPDQGPIIVGADRPTWKSLELQHLEAALEFYGEQTSDKLRSTGEPTLHTRETILRESLDLSGEAYIGHKNLLDVSGSISLGIEDRWDDNFTIDDKRHDRNLRDLYDISGVILQNGPVPVTVYTRREESTLNRAFASTIDNILTESGFIARVASARAPTTVQYFHREQEQNDHLGEIDSNVVQDSFSVQSNILISSNQNLEVNYTFDSVDEKQQGGFHNNYDRNDLNVIHTAGFGADNLSSLRSSFRYYDETGITPYDVTRLDELLILHHSDTLETRYTASAQQQTAFGEDQRLYRGDAQIRHHLFQSLVSSATIGAQRLEALDNFESDEWFLFGSLDYTKQVAYGRLDASVGAAYNAQHNSARGSTLSVLNETHTFNDPFPIVVSRRNIVPGSIFVTGPGGIPTFLEGFDYTVQVFPDRAEIRPIIGRGIVDGAQVEVSYDIGPEPSSDIDTIGTSISARYGLTEGALRGLGVYATYRTQDHTVDAADPSLFVFDDGHDLLLGVEYVRDALDLKVERQIHDSTTNPYETTRFEGLYAQRIGRDSVISADLTHEITDYSEPENHLNFTRLTGRWDQRLGQDFLFNLRLEYRRDDDDLRGNSEGFDESLGFTWHKRQTTIYGALRNASLDGDQSRTTTQFLQLGLRRAF